MKPTEKKPCRQIRIDDPEVVAALDHMAKTEGRKKGWMAQMALRRYFNLDQTQAGAQ